MKRKFSVLFALGILLLLLPLIVNAEIISSGTCGADLSWTLDDEGLLIISGTGAMDSYRVYDARPWPIRSVNKIIVEEGVTSIGSYAFFGGTSSSYAPITELILPDSIKGIGSSAFQECKQLKKVVLGKNVTGIGEYAFRSCTQLEELTIPDSAYCYVGNCGPFYGCNKLKDVTLLVVTGQGRAGLNEFPWGKINKCVFSDNLTNISANAFKECSFLTNVTIPEGVTSIGDQAFYNCKNLYNIVLPNTLETIGTDAFYGCSELTCLTIPEGVRSIGNNHFGTTTGLKKIYMPNSISSLAEDSYHSSTYVNPQTGEIIITKSPYTIYGYEYSYAESFAAQHGYAFSLVTGSFIKDHGEIFLPEELTLFTGESELLCVSVFPCSSNTAVFWSSDNDSIASVDQNREVHANSRGIATINVSTDSLHAHVTVTVNEHVSEIIIPEELYMVARTEMPFPITIFPKEAVANLSINSEDSTYASVSSGTIASGAVGETTITVQDTLTGISSSTRVIVCYPVTAIEFESSEYTIYPYETKRLTANVTMRTQSCVNQLITFTSNNPDIASVDEHGNVCGKSGGLVTIIATAESGISATTTVNVRPLSVLKLPMDLQAIEANAFEGTDCEIVVIPSNCTSIGDSAFAKCPKLKRIIIPASVNFIADSAFHDSGLQTICGAPNSAAETFAQQNYLEFAAIDDELLAMY